MIKRTPTFTFPNKAMNNLAKAIFNLESITAISNLIVEIGINTLNLVDKQGNNILHIATQFHPNDIIISMLLPSIADPDATNKNGYKALDKATQYLHTHVADEINHYMNYNNAFQLDLNNPFYYYHYTAEFCGLCMRNTPTIAASDMYNYDQ
jgi:ankyrin repeat protein